MINTISTTTRSLVNKIKLSVAQQKESYDYEKAAEQAKRQKIQKHGAVMGSIVNHVESEQFRKSFKVIKYVHKHGWCCLHMWMIDHRSRLLNCRWRELTSALLFRMRLKFMMNGFNYSEIQSYTDRHEPKVYFELRRIQNALYWSLDDHFVYNFKQKSLDQIVCEDMGLYPTESEEIDQQNVDKITQYIRSKMTELNEASLADIRSGRFKWTL